MTFRAIDELKHHSLGGMLLAQFGLGSQTISRIKVNGKKYPSAGSRPGQAPFRAWQLAATPLLSLVSPASSAGVNTASWPGLTNVSPLPRWCCSQWALPAWS
jgi:hypothetical protein